MSDEMYQKTFEDHYYESERLNVEARKELYQSKKEIEQLQAEIAELKRKLDLALADREALAKCAEFYSNEDNIVLSSDEKGFEEQCEASGYWTVYGKRARQALAQIRGEG